MDVEGVAIDLLSRSGANVDECCEAIPGCILIQSDLHFGSYDVQEQVSSRAPTFENCYIPQATANMEATELGSRAAPLGIYYSSQQPIGFSSVSSVQDGYYGHPATIQAMGNLHSINGRMNQYETQPSIQGAGQTSFRGSAIRGCYHMEGTLHDMTMESSSQFQGSGPSHPSDHRLSH
ncbi:unnamed protein product [Eruca vesicaria subsp. sativa]|uniref:Uncharacterized protein n=1 Tax=Eruca vesicaria subsp. sativa TaxID=29727 RepID=A0ABC8LBG0_ERUVS|nr:unnamed protein product [Eruca vesicaria subsp. sativa]